MMLSMHMVDIMILLAKWFTCDFVKPCNSEYQDINRSISGVSINDNGVNFKRLQATKK